MNARRRTPALLALALVLSVAGLMDGATVWKKYVAADKTFSFHYPRGWKVDARESTIEITNGASSEQLLVVALPYDKAKTPADSANFLIDALRSSTPDIKALGWQSDPATQDTAVRCQVSYTDNGRANLSEVLVVKDEASRQTFWFSYSGPKAGYSRERGLHLLGGLVTSMAKGLDSQPPQESAEPPAASPAAPSAPAMPSVLERNSRAFMFVLEFSLGAPLTIGQEETVLAELRRGWSARSGAELAKYDAYPKIVEAITHATDAKAVDDLRLKLEQSVREWLAASDAQDPAVAVVRSALKQKGQVLVAGDPPLTVMAADAYSEIYAYSELLRRSPQASPDNVSAGAVAETRRRLLESWKGFTAEERREVARTPGLWVSLRSVLRYGSAADGSQVRAAIGRIAAPAESSGAGGASATSVGGSGKRNVVGELVKHQVLMNVQQMTFNTYLYCHGFKSTIF